MMSLPWRAGQPLPADEFREVQMRAIFDYHKWDPQVADESILADFPLVLKPETWTLLRDLSERLAVETLAAETELARRPGLHPALALPTPVARLWKRRNPAAHPDDVRIMRFDFHYTTDGWRISEVNSDVPGGFNEAGGFTGLMAECTPGAASTGDPAAALAAAIRRVVPDGGLVALVHATAYTDDRQVMRYLADHLEAEGLRPAFCSPSHLAWENGRVCLNVGEERGDVAFLVRFFPSEWLPNLPASHWQPFFVSCPVPSCNPTLAMFSQSKRFPLTWDALDTDLSTWRALLPETRAPRGLNGAGWVYKPAWGRVGEGVGIPGLTPAKDWRAIRRAVWLRPHNWIAQQRFDVLPLDVNGENCYPCVGVYTVNGRAAGIYARMGRNPIVNAVAKDVAVLVET